MNSCALVCVEWEAVLVEPRGSNNIQINSVHYPQQTDPMDGSL
jgi:hypothetical protein